MAVSTSRPVVTPTPTKFSDSLTSNDETNTAQAYLGYKYRGVQNYGYLASGLQNYGWKSKGGVTLGKEATGNIHIGSNLQSEVDKHLLISGDKSAKFVDIIDATKQVSEYQQWLAYESPPLNLSLTYVLVVPWISQGELAFSTSGGLLSLYYANRSTTEHYVNYHMFSSDKSASTANQVLAGNAGGVWSLSNLMKGENMLKVFDSINGFDSREGKIRIINRATGVITGIEFYIYPTTSNTFKFMYRRI